MGLGCNCETIESCFNFQFSAELRTQKIAIVIRPAVWQATLILMTNLADWASVGFLLLCYLVMSVFSEFLSLVDLKDRKSSLERKRQIAHVDTFCNCHEFN